MKPLIYGLIALLLSIGLDANKNVCRPAENSIVDFGGSYTRSKIDPEGQSDFDGNMWGVQGNYQYRPLKSIYAAIGGNWRYGKNTGSSGVRDLTDASVHERIGYTFCINRLLVSAYSGFGYRFLGHHVKPNSGSDIKLYYHEFFIPVGWQSVYDMNRCISIGFNAVWMPQVFSSVTFKMVDGARWVTKNTYKNFNISLPLYYHFKCINNLKLVLNPFFEFWQDGETTAETQFNDPLGLPKNNYTFWGAQLNLQYAF